MANDADGNIGQFARLFGSEIACVNLSGRGDRAQSFAADDEHSAARRELLDYCSFVALGHGINDLDSGRTAAQLDADNATIAGQVGKPAVWSTLNPFTVGDLVTPWNGPKEAQRQAYNTLVRARSVYYDPCGVMEIGATGAWSCEDAVSIDYLHETAAGNAYAAVHGALVGTTGEVHGLAARAAGAVMPSLGTNLLAASRDLSVGTWANAGATIVTGQLDAECGSTGHRMQETATNAQHGLGQGTISKAAAVKTYELWMDVAPQQRAFVFFEITDGSFAKNAYAASNLTTGVVSYLFNLDAPNIDFSAASIAPLTNGFWRCKGTLIVSAAVTGLYIQVKTSPDGSGGSYLGSTANGVLMRPSMWMREVA